MSVLGLDIGGANIKAADVAGRAYSSPFAVWREPTRLAEELTAILKQFPRTNRIAVTMTAELADCFSTKAEGVSFVLDAVEVSGRRFWEDASPEDVSGRITVWTTESHFVSCPSARKNSLKVAAANWHALATWCGRFVPDGPALLVDIGTTTTDIIPLRNGKPVPIGLTDTDRLQTGELAYSGVRRTPLCAVAHSVPFRSGYCSIAAELFAATLDIYLLLDQLAEDDQNLETANGKPATKAAAHDRIARLLCGDREEITFAEAVQIARFLADVQRQRLAGALERVAQRLSNPIPQVVLSGSGLFLARQLVSENRHTANAQVFSLSDQLSPEIAEAACAHAVACLRSETV